MISHGLDISYAQGTVNFDQLRPHADFIVIREGFGDTVGTIGLDTQYKRNITEARRVQFPLATYHYCYFDYNDPVTEANSYVDSLLANGGINTGEVLVLDFEEKDPNDHVQGVLAFCNQVKARVGFMPLVYLNRSEVLAHDWSPVANAGIGLWLAEWNGLSAPDPVPYWSFIAMWQYADNSSFPGVNGHVDGDIFYGTIDQFLKYGKPEPTPVPPPPAPEPQPVPTPLPAPTPPVPVPPVPVPPTPSPTPPTNVNFLIAIGTLIVGAALILWKILFP